MRHEIQVHFNNSGVVSWHEDIEDVEIRLSELMHEKRPIVHDKETGRYFALDMSTITVIVVTNKVLENDGDIFRRTYATNQVGE